MITTCTCSIKGGVGKTSTVLNLALYAALDKSSRPDGFRVLVVDADPQANLSDTLRYDPEHIGLVDILADTDNTIKITDAIQKTEYVDLIAGSKYLKDIQGFAQEANIDASVLRRRLEEVSDQYDFCFVDTGPQVSFCQVCGLACADMVLIPLTADRYAISGVAQIYEFISDNFGDSLPIGGLLLTRHSDNMILTRQMREVISDTAEAIGSKLYKQAIRETVKVREAQTLQIPLPLYAPNCTAAIDYKEVYNEFISDIKDRYGSQIK